MEFKKYQHVEKYGNTEVDSIEFGRCYVFPKLDGTNASMWVDKNGEICCGSRNRQLSLDDDNAGFMNWAIKQNHLCKMVRENPENRFYGEWLVPHSLKTYKEDAWKRFYIFDVCSYDDEETKYINYEDYSTVLENYGVDYIPPICSIETSSYEQFVLQLEKNVFMIKDGEGSGEGIVIKNYDFKNRFGRTNWAKIVTSEFKEKHAKVMGSPAMNGKEMIEKEIVNNFLTTAMCEKVYEKIKNDDGWNNKKIPQLLNVVFYDFITEEIWSILKKYKNPKIDFKTLQHFIFITVKEKMNKLF